MGAHAKFLISGITFTATAIIALFPPLARAETDRFSTFEIVCVESDAGGMQCIETEVLLFLKDLGWQLNIKDMNRALDILQKQGHLEDQSNLLVICAQGGATDRKIDLNPMGLGKRQRPSLSLAVVSRSLARKIGSLVKTVGEFWLG